MHDIEIYCNNESRDNKNNLQNTMGISSLMRTSQNNNNILQTPTIIFVKALNVPLLHLTYCISEFLLLHFRPLNVITLDILDRGKYCQNHKELTLPLLRKISCIHSTKYNNNNNNNNDNNNKEAKNENETENIVIANETNTGNDEYICQQEDYVLFLETGNLISSLASSIMQMCVIKEIDCLLYVSVSDMDYFGETLSQFGNILIQRSSYLRKLIIKTNNNNKNKQESLNESNVYNFVSKKIARLLL